MTRSLRPLNPYLTGVYIDNPIVREFVGRYGGCFSTVEVLPFTPCLFLFPLSTVGRRKASGPTNYSELRLRGCLHSFSNETPAVALTGHMN